MFRVWIALAALVWGTHTQAAVVSYEYTGNDFECALGEEGCGPGFAGDSFSGILDIEEGLLPGGSVAGLEILLNATLSESPPFDISFETKVTLNGVTWTAPGTPGISFAGIITRTLTGLVSGSSSYQLTFDANGEIVDWLGISGEQGGGNDFTTSPLGDFDGAGNEAAPGTWSLISGGGNGGEFAPAPIPLPASGWPLLLALVVLLIGRRMMARRQD